MKQVLLHNNTTMRASRQKGLLFFNTAVIFTFLSAFLFAIDFVPEQSAEARLDSGQLLVQSEALVENDVSSTSSMMYKSSTIHSYRMPIRVKVPTIGLDTPIVMSESTDVTDLDAALLKGAVHYPDSGLPGESANMLLFAHSSYLPVVNNKAFKAFNELGKLTKGDIINVYTESEVYTYRTLEVRLERAGNVTIQFNADEPMLTLATCNNFGAEEERFVVTAVFESKASFN